MYEFEISLSPRVNSEMIEKVFGKNKIIIDNYKHFHPNLLTLDMLKKGLKPLKCNNDPEGLYCAILSAFMNFSPITKYFQDSQETEDTPYFFSLLKSMFTQKKSLKVSKIDVDEFI